MVHARADNRYTRGLAEFSSGLSYQRIPADCSRGDRKTINPTHTASGLLHRNGPALATADVGSRPPRIRAPQSF